MSTYDDLIAFLAGLGTEQVAHTQGTFLEHLIAVDRDLRTWGCDEAVCRAGMFHSIYGTEKFQRFSLPLLRRDEVRRLIGERAERLAYANCAMDRSSLDRLVEQDLETYPIVDRLSPTPIELTRGEFDDLCRVHLCDWLEQAPRSQQWNYRRAAYRAMARRLGGIAEREYARVFQMEPKAAPVGREQI